MDMDERIVTLIDEEGEPFEFVIIDCFTVEAQEYAIMVPLQDDEDDEELEGELELESSDEREELEDSSLEEEDMEEEEAVIFRLSRGEEGETSFQLIEDEEEWQKVSEVAFERLYQSEEE